MIERNYQIIADNLRYLRIMHQLTQEQVAEKANISVEHYNKIENNKRHIGMRTYLKILDSYDLTEKDHILYAVKKIPEDLYVEIIKNVLQECNEDEIRILLDIILSIKILLNKM